MNNGIRTAFEVFIFVIIHSLTYGQGLQQKIPLNWVGVQSIHGSHYEPVKVLVAGGLINNATKNYTPEFFGKYALPEGIRNCDVLITHTLWEPISQEQLDQLTYPLQPDTVLSPVIQTGTERGISMVMIRIVPVIKNPAGGIMRLTSFTLDIVYLPPGENCPAGKANLFASHSVLAQGNWYKIQLHKTGLYKITYSEIKNMGVDMTTVTPSSIRLFGNGGSMLPEANHAPRYDDLTENAIQVVTANPAVFGPGDYILFYGTAPDKLYFDKTARKYQHLLNLYSDFTFYFLNFDGGTGLRIKDEDQSVLIPNHTCTSFLDGVFYEMDDLNLINSGKDWVGERMDSHFPVFELPVYVFPGILEGKQAWLRYRLIARSPEASDFTVKINGSEVAKPMLLKAEGDTYATESTGIKSFYPESSTIKVTIRYNGSGESIGWLDWVELNIQRDLVFAGGQMAFADPFSASTGFVTDFQLKSPSSSVTVWEITDPLKVKRVRSDIQGDMTRFVLTADSLRQFIAWDNTVFLSAVFAGKIENQDLHGIESADMLIVAHKDFLDQANRLAEFHRVADGMKVTVATNEQVYNEFSSGAPDICAIRDFARKLYQFPENASKLQFLLLFGDGSFDYKDRVPGNTNRVLTFQSSLSLNKIFSIVSDDFFGLLDDNEGNDADGLIDIGIGRFPVNSVADAKLLVDKCLYYAGNSAATLGDWRNKLCFVSDDGNQNYHFNQVESQICPLIEANSPVYNLSKVYLDGFKQVATPGGQRCPDANAAINSSMENGMLVMNYTGHGGGMGWADEGILTIRDIDSWTNYNHMPVFFTATCELSRFDEPGLLSAGEHIILNPTGGSMAMFTTTRPADASINLGLTQSFYDTIFSGTKGNYTHFGNAIAYAKNRVDGGNSSTSRNFLLLGDPALSLAFPRNKVIITQINGKETNQDGDTIHAMSLVNMKGIVADETGNKITGFTGIADIKVFDKIRTLKTLGTDPGDFPAQYTVQDNYIYQGRASITNGDFEAEFIVPRDIDYNFGPGKISIYAHDALTDANGFSKQLIIGGSEDNSSDTAGPKIKLYLNDLSFENGGITGDTPLLIAQLNDENGINTLSNAIGHEIVAVLDGDNSTSVVLNSYYCADLDSYKSGVVKYKFASLPEGMHTLTLKAWDVFNNSAVATLSFKVIKNMKIAITKVNVYPNPFGDEVKAEIEISLFDTPVEMWLEVFNLNGSLLQSTEPRLLVSEGFKAGELVWDGRTSSGATAPPGAYLFCIRAKNKTSQTLKATRVVKIR